MSKLLSSSGTYRARWIVPVTRPPIHNGVIRIKNGKIAEVDSYNGQDATDLGDFAVLPGLVNAHTHLEFSNLQQPIGVEGMLVARWLVEVMRHRKDNAQTEESRLRAIKAGIDESVAAGTVLLGEIASQPWPIDSIGEYLTQHSEKSPEVVAFWEVLGLTVERQSELYNWSAEQMAADAKANLHQGISPHAPYSSPPPLTAACVSRAMKEQTPLAMHVAESREERLLVEQGDGAMRDAFESLGLPGLELFPSSESISELLERLVAAPRTLIVHGNYLTDGEIGLLAKHSESTSVVYCPRTHAYFRHAPHPVDRMQAAGLRVALGTDSRASNPDLSIWKEVQHLAQHRQDISPAKVVEMATLCGAEALGRADYGRLEAGCCGRLFLTENTSANEAQLWDTITNCE